MKTAATEVLNASSRRVLLDESSEQDNLIDHDYITNWKHISEWGERIITYVAGYVAHKLAAKLACEQCTKALFVAEPTAATNSFIQQKSRGGLRNSSQSVLTTA